MAAPGVAALVAGGVEALRGGGLKESLIAGARGAALDVSPGFRAFERLNQGKEALQLRAEDIRIKQGELDIKRKADEALKKPFDMRKLIGTADSSGKLSTAVEAELVRVGADVDGNGVTTQEELNKVLPKLDFTNISKELDASVKRNEQLSTMLNNNVKKELEKVNKDLATSGSPLLTLRDFETNPELSRAFPSVTLALNEVSQQDQGRDLLISRQKMISGFVKEEKKPSVSQQKLDIVQSDAFREDIAQAEDLVVRIRGGEEISIGDKKLTTQDVVDRLENQYPEISGEIRARLRELDRSPTFKFDFSGIAKDVIDAAGNQP